jgi:hypothetical protein
MGLTAMSSDRTGSTAKNAAIRWNANRAAIDFLLLLWSWACMDEQLLARIANKLVLVSEARLGPAACYM